MSIKVALSTVSDKGAAGQRVDESGPIMAKMLSGIAEITLSLIIPDEREIIEAELKKIADNNEADIILTSGGTGFAPRDVTPEATCAVCSRMAPGIPEAMRSKSLEITSRAMLSRAAAGIRGKTLIVNMPGSPKAVSECMEVIIPVLGHAVELLRGDSGDCARV